MISGEQIPQSVGQTDAGDQGHDVADDHLVHAAHQGQPQRKECQHTCAESTEKFIEDAVGYGFFKSFGQQLYQCTHKKGNQSIRQTTAKKQGKGTGNDSASEALQPERIGFGRQSILKFFANLFRG